MKNQIESATEKGSISEEIRSQHKGFLEWDHKVSKQNHQPIVQVINNVVLLCDEICWNKFFMLFYLLIFMCVVNFR